MRNHRSKLRVVQASTIGMVAATMFSASMIPVLANEGSSNSIFSTDGYVSLSQNWSPASTYSYGVATDSQNRVVVVGDIEASNGNPMKSFVARYLPTGELDTSFSTDGKVAIGTDSWFETVVIDKFDRVLAVGTDMSSVGHIVRFTTSGALDPSFGSDGEVTIPGNQIRNIKLDALQRIIILRLAPVADSYYLSRYSANGQLDLSFGPGSDHIVRIEDLGTASPSFRGLTLDDSGRIYVGGTIEPFPQGDLPEEFATVVRYSANGDLDTSFGAPNGYIKVIPDTQGLFAVADRLMSVHVQSSGRIIVAGVTRYGTERITSDDYSGVPFIAAFTATGAIDSTFGTNGVTNIGSITSHTEYQRPLAAVINQADQLTIFSRGNSQESGLVSRLTKDGQVDSSFGASGTFSWAPNSDAVEDWFGQSSTISESGAIYFAGTFTPDNNVYNGFISSFKGSVPRQIPGGTLIKYVKSAKLTGSSKQGKTIAATAGTWTSRLKLTYTFKWYSCSKQSTTASTSVPSTCKAIPNATSRTYKIAKKSKYVKKYLRVKITAKNGLTSKYVLTASTSKVK